MTGLIAFALGAPFEAQDQLRRSPYDVCVCWKSDTKSFLQGLKPDSSATLRGGYKPPPPKEGRG